MVFGKSVKLTEEQALKKTKVKQADDGLLEQDKRERKLEQQQVLYSSVFWGVVSVFLLGLSISLIALGDLNEIPDLIILGGIFLVAGTGFLILLFAIVCKPFVTRWINRVTPEYTNGHYVNTLEDATKQDVEKLPKPTAFQLYGEDKIIHVPNPTVLPDPEFPLPPMVCHPNTVEELGEQVAIIELPIQNNPGNESHDPPIS